MAGVSGQHASVVCEAARLSGRFVLGVLSLSRGCTPDTFPDCTWLGPLQALGDDALPQNASYVVACGCNSERRRVSDELVERGKALDTIIHPQAILSPSSSIGVGTVVLAGAIIATAAHVGRCCIVNHCASVDHNCDIADFANICPGARLAGNVSVGAGAFIGIGASIVQGIHIGAESVVGAGATVVSDVPAATTFVGVPARPMRRRRDT